MTFRAATAENPLASTDRSADKLWPNQRHCSTKPTKPNSQKWTLTFQYIEKSPLFPTILYIVGGPGIGATADWDNDPVAKIHLRELGLPEKANYIFVDPRTAGCNGGQGSAFSFPIDSLTTQNMANDLLEVLKTLHPTNYFIYGNSYGTIEGTVLVSFLEKTGLHLPRVLILSGVFGKAAHGFEQNYYHAMWTGWNHLKKQLPEKVIRKLSVEKPLGLAPQVWAPFIANGVSAGEQYEFHDGGKFEWRVRDVLLKLVSDDPIVEAEVKKAVQFVPPSATGVSFKLFKLMACNEIWDDMTSIDFDRGNFVPVPGRNFCQGTTMPNPYDAAQWPIKRTPIVYIQGMIDTQTPYYGAKYHILSHPSIPRAVVLFPRYGHGWIGAIMDDCKNGFWAALSTPGGKLPLALSKCKAPHQTYWLRAH